MVSAANPNPPKYWPRRADASDRWLSRSGGAAFFAVQHARYGLAPGLRTGRTLHGFVDAQLLQAPQESVVEEGGGSDDFCRFWIPVNQVSDQCEPTGKFQIDDGEICLRVR